MVYAASFGGLTSFYLMLGITPLYAIEQGSSAFSAAITTTVFMLATVGAELATSAAIRRFGMQATLAIGIVLLALPSFILLASGELWVILAVSALRGTGFALVIIAGAAMIAALTDETRHGSGIAIYGVVVGIPSILALPFGVWLVDRVGFEVLFIAAGSVALLGVGTVLVPMQLPRPDEVHGMLQTLRRPAILRLSIAFLCSTFAAGVLITWLPITAGGAFGPWLAAIGLFAFGAAATGSRWVAGRIGDRYDPRRIVIPSLAVAATGLLAMAALPQLLVVGAFVFGFGLGGLQNSSLQLMFRGAGVSGYGSASAIWNIAYDLGLALGAFVFGLLAGSSSAPLFVSAGVVLAAIALMAVSKPALPKPALSTRAGSSGSSQVTPG